MQDIVVVVEGLEDDFDVVEVVEDGFEEVDIVLDEIAVVELLEDDVHDADVQDDVPESGCEVQTCIDVLHDVAVVDLDLQDEGGARPGTHKRVRCTSRR